MTPHTESIELRADGLLLRFSSNLLSFLADREDWRRSVSYTHLTLPTKRIV